MRYLIITFILLGLTNSVANAADCHFKYWEVIPSNTCKVYYLPDFTFGTIPHDADAPEHIKRFCSSYEIVSKFGKQRAGYCYTGEGDYIGPTFKLGDAKWHFQDKKKGDIYFADFGFKGCFKGQKTTGIVFGVFGWEEAPKDIERSFPVEGKLAKCER